MTIVETFVQTGDIAATNNCLPSYQFWVTSAGRGAKERRRHYTVLAMARGAFPTNQGSKQD